MGYRYSCMPNAACVDVSTDTDPATQCVCQMGKIFAADGVTCVDTPPPPPTPPPYSSRSRHSLCFRTSSLL